MILVLPVDIQKGLDEYAYWGGERSNPAFEANVARLLAAARQMGHEIIHIRHDSTNPKSPLRPGQPGNEFKAQAAPMEGEPVIAKSVNSAFIGTDLEQCLHDLAADHLVIFGLTAEHCVSTTTRMAGNLGFRVSLVGDATAAFPTVTPDGEAIDAETHHRVHLAALHREFATVITTDEAVSLLSAGD
ncbi:cysteine hydrolase family protein [Hyphobacterium sp. HN65]|uniref:Cysteine hydrolase family protein n=1 Tax=Hyphobacterium lacteum TaxID=3116575 RepID=A0ABU7LQ81_9PROT|nr:cysteine hydrolase family protein [Hyphobacterium sp. HN65]MEE2526048.1 cysteine hydrolase family protein [Hyphobacterium sp. HN65]